MTWPTTNKQAAKNIVCWQCEHFQRYDDTPDTQDCQGECRKTPPLFQGDLHNFTQISTGENTSLFGFVPFGNTTWCNGFQRSLEDNIPDVVVGKDNCTAQNWGAFTTPYDTWTSNPPLPRKKSILESCWYCEHFQNADDPPSSQCLGYCMLQPPTAYNNENYDPTGTGINRTGYGYGNLLLQFAAWYWCSKWERSIDPVADPPEDQGVPCGGGA